MLYGFHTDESVIQTKTPQDFIYFKSLLNFSQRQLPRRALSSVATGLAVFYKKYWNAVERDEMTG
jgi:hypothetical protein